MYINEGPARLDIDGAHQYSYSEDREQVAYQHSCLNLQEVLGREDPGPDLQEDWKRGVVSTEETMGSLHP